MKEVCALLCVLSYFVLVLMIPFPILCTTLQDCGEEAAYTRTHTHTATHTHTLEGSTEDAALGKAEVGSLAMALAYVQ